MRSDQTVACQRCVVRFERDDHCPRCGDDDLIDLNSAEQRAALAEALVREHDATQEMMGRSLRGWFVVRRQRLPWRVAPSMNLRLGGSIGFVLAVVITACAVPSLLDHIARLPTPEQKLEAWWLLFPVFVVAFVSTSGVAAAFLPIVRVVFRVSATLLLFLYSPIGYRRDRARPPELTLGLHLAPEGRPRRLPRLVGTVRMHSALTAPRSGRECVAFRLVGTGPSGPVDEVAAADFDLLDTEAGDVRVEIEHSVLQLPSPANQHADSSSRLWEYLEPRGVLGDEERLLLGETVVSDGDEVEVFGNWDRARAADYRDGGGQRVVRGTPAQPLYVRARNRR